MEPIKAKKGFTLIEVVVALVVLTVTFSVLFSLIHLSMENYQKAKRKWDNFLCALKKENGEVISYKGFNLEVRSCGGIKFYILKK